MAIETFEGLPIVDTGGRALISALDAKKISFPNDGADFGNAGDQLRSLGNGGVEWAAPGMPTYEQTEQALSNWLDAHPEAVTTVEDGAITDAKLNDALKRGLVFGFETVADMKASTALESGMVCHTNGFYASGDGGAAWYTVSDSGTANEMDVIACGELFATLVYKNEVFAEQIGMASNENFDNAQILEDFFSANKSAIIKFHAGVYRFSAVTLDGTDDGARPSGFSLVGVKNAFPYLSLQNGVPKCGDFIAANENAATIFAPYTAVQSHILKLKHLCNTTVSNITFTSIGYRSEYDNSYLDVEAIQDAALVLDDAQLGNYENNKFLIIKGVAISIDNCWESRFTNNDFRWIVPDKTPVSCGAITFESINAAINNSALIFDGLNFESVACHCFYGNAAVVRNTVLSNILYEGSAATSEYTTGTDYGNNAFPSISVGNTLSILSCDNCTSYFDFSISNLSIDRMAVTFTYNGVEYGFAAIFSTHSDTVFRCIAESIAFDRVSSNHYMYSGTSEMSGYSKSLHVLGVNYGGGAGRLTPIRGTLSEIEIPNLFKLMGNVANAIQDNGILDTFPKTNSTYRMWKESSLANENISKIAPTPGSDATLQNKTVVAMNAFGISTLYVCASPNANLTIGRYRSGTIVDMATNVYNGSSMSMFKLVNTAVDSPTISDRILISGNGVTASEIFYIKTA